MNTFRVSVPPAQRIGTNQATAFTDMDGDGTFEDEATADAVAVSNVARLVRQPLVMKAPVLSPVGLAVGAVIRVGMGFFALRRRRRRV